MLRFPVDRMRADEPRPELARVAVRRVLAEAPCRVDFLDAIVNEVLWEGQRFGCAGALVHLGG
ncbi:MAG: hypothetical protein IBX63_06655 [Coriobacteriia bacterium]|nr:hypothetical protein [Coriobacteriia bacterium]